MNEKRAFEAIAKSKTADNKSLGEEDTGMEPETRVRRKINLEVLPIQNDCVVITGKVLRSLSIVSAGEIEHTCRCSGHQQCGNHEDVE